MTDSQEGGTDDANANGTTTDENPMATHDVEPQVSATLFSEQNGFKYRRLQTPSSVASEISVEDADEPSQDGSKVVVSIMLSGELPID